MSTGPDDAIVEAVAALGTVPWSGETWRHTAPRRTALTGEGARLFGGRWNSRGLAATIYLETSRDGCLAEFERTARNQGKGTSSFLPRSLHRIQLHAVELVNLVDKSALDAVGLEVEDIDDNDWGPCQAVGDAAYLLGYTGLIAPSATSVGSVIALFESRITRGAVEVIESTSLT